MRKVTLYYISCTSLDVKRTYAVDRYWMLKDHMQWVDISEKDIMTDTTMQNVSWYLKKK